jgi:hypothetical protein
VITKTPPPGGRSGFRHRALIILKSKAATGISVKRIRLVSEFRESGTPVGRGQPGRREGQAVSLTTIGNALRPRWYMQTTVGDRIEPVVRLRGPDGHAARLSGQVRQPEE